MLRRLAVAGTAAAGAVRLFSQAATPAATSASTITGFLESLRKSDGAYGWGGQEMSHLAPTFGVVGAYRLLKIIPPKRESLITFVRTHHPRDLKARPQEMRIFDWQQVQALQWLGADTSDFRERIAALTKPLEYNRNFEQHGYPVAQSELSVVLAHTLLGLPTAGISDAFGSYLDERRRANGSFNNAPTTDGGDGHVTNTFWALQSLQALGRAFPPRDALIAWLRACQLPNGGFTYQPLPPFGGVDDIAYVHAGVRSLHLLGAAPVQREACIAYIHSLANADGGFGDRPGWLSNATATYHALDALATLGALETLSGVKRRPLRPRSVLPDGLKVISAQLEAHGTGSPADAVELARSLQIDLWGAKNAKPGWVARFAAIAAEHKVPVTCFTANEEYGTWVDVPGLGTFSHTSDLVAPAGADIGAALGTRHSPPVPVSWPEFRMRRLDPLHHGRGRLIWQYSENEPLARMLLDDSVERGGFAAIQTYHFGNPDHANTEPFLHRWRGQIPFVALQDAHGPEPWHFADFTTGFRTLFLATEPTWAGWLNALKQNWTVPARHDVWTKGKTWMHSGSDEVLEFVRAREAEWRWWDHPRRMRPMVSIVAVRPDDAFEAGRPESGVNFRVRCAWECTFQGVLKAPLAELVKLSVDGRAVSPTLVEAKRGGGQAGEYAHFFALPADEAKGNHTVTAVVREIATRHQIERTIAFHG
ncbi:MAG: hypothetical protein JNK23_20915 [Opitutaceae bacterium]|nr:hypothetical protein [Opitutaceae bacterium]